MTNAKKPKLPPASNWKARDISDWNVHSFNAYIAEMTLEKFGVTYAPGGGGSRSQRFSRENGMLKQAQGRYGNAVLRRFFEICWREYQPSAAYPFLTVGFAISYLDRNFTKAQAEVAAEARAERAAANVEKIDADWW